MNYNVAKNFAESLIFSASEPLSKNDIKKMLLEHGDFDIDKIINELINDYSLRGIILFSSDKNFNYPFYLRKTTLKHCSL